LLRPKRPGLKLGLSLLAVLTAVVVGTLGTLHYRALYQRVANAKELLLTAQESLQERRLDATASELAKARAQLREAEEGFGASRDALQGDPLVWVLRRVPGLGRQVSVAQDVLVMGTEASEIGLAGVDVADEYSAVRSESESGITEKAMVLLDKVRPHMAELGSRLDTVLAKRERIGDGALLPPLRDALAEVDEHSKELEELVNTYDQAAAFFPDFLGFRGPRTYLVLAQNNAELLPTGGLITVYGTLTLREGRVEQMSFADAIEFSEAWQKRAPEYVEPPAPLKYYLLKDGSWSLDLANWSPDFPTAARQAQFFFEKGGGRPVDGIIAINVNTLQELLGVTGPVPVPEYAVTVDKENALELTEALTRTPLEPGADRKAFVAFLAEEMLQRLMRLPSPQWTPLLDTVEELRDEKNILFYSFNPDLQAVVHDMRLDGALQDPPGDYLMPVEASVNSTKLNIIIDEEIDLQIALDELGNAHSELGLRYENDLASWEEGRDPELVRRLMLDGLYGGYLRLFTKANSRLVSVKIDGAEAGASELTEENGKTVFGRFFALPKGAKRELSFSYVTPAIVDFRGDAAEYRLLIQKQPGTGAIPLRIRLILPEGAEPVSLELDGESLDSKNLEVQTDISRDREIVLRYRPGG
jgi:hypothetical protein